MIQRTGEVVIRMLADVKQKTIGPLVRQVIAPGTVVYTDEYDIYARLSQWGYTHHTVCHAAGEFPGRRRRLKGAPGRGTLAKEKPPIFGMIQRGGEIVIRMLADVKQRTIGPLIKATVAPGAIVDTDEYDIYARLPQWGYTHHTVCHAAGEFARDDDGDGFCEVHVNTMEGCWSLLRPWLRPHRGISQDKLPLYLSFCQFVHNARRRGKALLGALITALLS